MEADHTLGPRGAAERGGNRDRDAEACFRRFRYGTGVRVFDSSGSGQGRGSVFSRFGVQGAGFRVSGWSDRGDSSILGDGNLVFQVSPTSM